MLPFFKCLTTQNRCTTCHGPLIQRLYIISNVLDNSLILLLKCFVNFVLFSFLFSRYSFFFDWSKLTSIVNILRITRFLNSLILCQPRPADFFAYFQPGSSTILSLICCDGQLKQQVIQELKVDGISHASSKKNMIPEYDKAFVFVSGGIRLSNREEMEDCYLR